MTLKMPSQARISLPLDRVESFCRKWGVEELSLFGSVLREDFSSEGLYEPASIRRTASASSSIEPR
jgi:hypothetical protein